MRKGDPDDPLLRQVLPLDAEGRILPGFSTDPLGERGAMPAAGVLHKYHGRVLLTLTGACAVHCRYCFRRHYPYSDANAGRANAQGAIEYLQRHPEVEELILSGGDPLSLSDNRLQSLVARLTSIRTLKRLRIHSRLPVVLPERVDHGLLNWMSTPRFKVVLVIHCNHANEIDAQVHNAMDQLRAAGVTLLNQSVLLRGVNDRLDVLLELSERLFEAGVLPYYLHQLDPVQGAAHFAVSQETGRQLVDAMRARLPGYLVPRMVREDLQLQLGGTAAFWAIVLPRTGRVIGKFTLFGINPDNRRAEIGYVLLVPLGAIIFMSIGRHPLAGLAAAFATMVALHSGVGQVVDANLLETMFHMMGPLASLYGVTGEQQPRLGAGLPYTVPRGTYRCADGRWVAVSTSSDTVAARVMEGLGVGDDPRFDTFAGRTEHRDELDRRDPAADRPRHDLRQVDALVGVDRVHERAEQERAWLTPYVDGNGGGLAIGGRF